MAAVVDERAYASRADTGASPLQKDGSHGGEEFSVKDKR